MEPEPLSDPSHILNPDVTAGPSSSPHLHTPKSPSVRPSNRRPFFIEPPLLSMEQKKQYKTLPETTLKSEVELAVDEVIGEYREGHNLYYFARYDGGIAHKFPSKPFLEKFAHLVEDYERRKRAGKLKPFDPSASYVHPRSRVRMIVNISNNRATVNISSARSLRSKDRVEVVSDSEGEEDSSDDDEASEDGYDSGGKPEGPRRRSGRTQTKLPFRPQGSRARRVYVVDSDSGSERGPVRRSTRAKKAAAIDLDADAYSEGSDSGGRSESSGSHSGSGEQKKKIVRGKASRPAYGHFRVVADLGYDSDEDTAPLREHRGICEKCHRAPAHELLNTLAKRPKAKGKQRKKTTDDEFEESGTEQERLVALGGWVRCLKCPVTAHWRCLASTQRDEILKAAKEKDQAAWRTLHPPSELQDQNDTLKEPGRRLGLDAYQTTEFICGACMKGGVCAGCMEVALEPDTVLQGKARDVGPSDHAQDGDVSVSGDIQGTNPKLAASSVSPHVPAELLFRCITCKRICHYAHLPLPSTLSPNAGVAEIASYYQSVSSWHCADCSSYSYALDKVIAWRPYPANATEPPRPLNDPPPFKTALPREYLVKWQDRSYRRTTWVPHMWLVSTNLAKLRNFLTGGTRVELLNEAAKEDDVMDVKEPVFNVVSNSRASSTKPGTTTPSAPQDPAPDAEGRIPPAWKTADRVLDILLWDPARRSKKDKKGKGKAKSAGSDSEDEPEEDTQQKRTSLFVDGEEPNSQLTETVSDWEDRTNQTFGIENIGQIVWAFIKWQDLGYDEATWDSPPYLKDPGYHAFESAVRRFIASRGVTVRKLSKAHSAEFDNRVKDDFRHRHLLTDAAKLNLGQNPQLKLMPFQVDGFNWLCNNWWNLQHCILADEMGLGKTVQIATFLGNISDKFQAFPALVVVPNSTITNWVREFERWAPNLRVVPFYGEAKARDVIKRFELSHEFKRAGETGAKFHVLVTTYEAFTNPKDFTLFKSQPRWEVLIIDEGQRLKSDSSLLFKKLNELNSIHRIIMTGTPLNNNMRELFNLMNFLDPEEWRDLEALEKEHEELNEELVKQLHNRLRPYFLRRIKSEVLQLPPKNEVIVPVSMAPLQKEVYRSILSHNLAVLNGLTQPSGFKTSSSGTASRVNNVLMQLRKCLQHPYLYAEDIEPKGLAPEEAHEKLIDGSAKLRFLKVLLPKLKERGHRILLFSQFVIALNVIEDFLEGEGHKFLRLDGNTKGADRQKGMDEFNRPGSDIFIYLLTTRAGGVGINLFSADTVIIFDPDFNPHQDLQAIARAYRYGQQKTCLVFKLMVKDSAEERIIQVGKKKLVLDHLIVQKMDDEDAAGENVQSILTYGAQALFESDQSARDIIYSDHDVEKLIEKTEREGDHTETAKEGGMSFSFAKIWAADKDSLEEVIEDNDQGDSWAQTLKKINAEREKVQSQVVAASGRGARRKAAAAASKANAYIEASPVKLKPTKKGESDSISAASDGSAYSGSVRESPGDDSDQSSEAAGPLDLPFENNGKFYPKNAQGLAFNGEPPSHSSFKLNGNPYPMHEAKTQGLTFNGGPPTDSSFRLNGYSHPRDAKTQSLGGLPMASTGVSRDSADCGLCGERHDEGCIMIQRSEDLADYRKLLLMHETDEPWELRNDAIQAIDETLDKRGDLSLIVGQPPFLVKKPSDTPHPVERQEFNTSINLRQPPTPSVPESPMPPGDTMGNQPEASMSRAPLAASHDMGVIPVAGPSKRLLSPSPVEEQPKKKKAKPSFPSCPVCNQSSQHLLKDCPVVAEGPQSVSKHIKRLDKDPTMSHTVDVLHKILVKQKKREVEQVIRTSDSATHDQSR